MKIVNIRFLEISNFKGVDFLSLDLDAKEVDILGKNKSGKTTILDSICWLIDGKNSDNTEKFPVKNVNKGNTEEDAVVTYVEAVLTIQDETGVKEHTFRRELHEIWGAEKRGSQNRILKGNTTKYFIDTIPVDTEQEYIKRFESILPNSLTFKILFNPHYFSQILTWKDRRNIIEKIIGKVTDADVLQIEPSLSGVIELLKEHPLSDILKRTNEEIKAINQKSLHIPALIRENEDQAKVLTERFNFDDIESKIFIKESQIKEDEATLLDGSKKNDVVNKQILELKEKKLDISSKISVATAEATIKFNAQSEELDNKISLYKDTVSKFETEIEQITSENSSIKESARRSIETLEKEILLYDRDILLQNETLERLREKFKEVSKSELKFKSGECPTCGVFHDADEITKDRKIALEKFNIDKAEELKKMNQQGVAIKEYIEGLEIKINNCKLDIEKLQAGLKQKLIANESSLTEAEINHAKSLALLGQIQKDKENSKIIPLNQFLADAGIDDLQLEIARLDTEIEKLEKSKETDQTSSIKESIYALKNEVKQLKDDLANKTIIDTMKVRAKQLADENKILQDRKSELEGIIFQLGEYERIKYSEIELRANNIFSYAKIQMFREQMNGGYESICEVTDNGVPFASVNSAGQVQVGLDVIQTLSKHYGYTLPVFIDNRESTSEIPSISNQVINLIVNSEYEKLVVNKKN